MGDVAIAPFFRKSACSNSAVRVLGLAAVE